MRKFILAIAIVVLQSAVYAEEAEQSLHQLLSEVSKITRSAEEKGALSEEDRARLLAIYPNSAKRPWGEYKAEIATADALNLLDFITLGSLLAYSPHAEKAYLEFNKSEQEREKLLVVFAYMEGRAPVGGEYIREATAIASDLSRSAKIGIATTATMSWILGLNSMKEPAEPAIARAMEIMTTLRKKEIRSPLEEQYLEMLSLVKSPKKSGEQDADPNRDAE